MTTAVDGALIYKMYENLCGRDFSLFLFSCTSFLFYSHIYYVLFCKNKIKTPTSAKFL